MRCFLICLCIVILLFGVLSCASVTEGSDISEKKTIASFQDEAREDHQSRETAPKELEKEPAPGGDSEEKSPDNTKEELGRDDLASFAFSYRPKGYYPLHRQGTALMVLGDIDGNTYTDAVVLYVKAEKREEAEVKGLSDISRLYSEEVRPFSCMIGSLLQSSNASVYRGPEVSLDEKLVLIDFSPLSIRNGKSTPLGVSLQFQDTEGFVEEWVIFSSPDTPYRFTLQDKPGLRTRKDDINDDGVRDVLFFEQDFEEGTGYETFITWYKWGGDSFIETASTNVVRNLNIFLGRVKSAVLAKNWSRFIDLSLPEEQYPSVQGRTTREDNSSRYALFKSMFLYVETISGKEESLEEDKWEWDSIQNITFPEILENPFDLDQGSRYIFPMEIRVVYREAVVLYRVYVEMAKNPFQGPQYWFVLQE